MSWQRTTHFRLGKRVKNKQVETQTQKRHKEKIAIKDHYKEYTNLNLLGGNSIRLGINSNKAMYRTVNNFQYVDHKKAKAQGLGKSRLKDLRSHHFKLGNWCPRMKTQYVREFPQKKSRPKTAFTGTQGVESRGMYFGNQKNTLYNTLYNVDYNKDYGKENLQGKQERDMIAQKIKQSHILLGDNPRSYYVTEQKSKFEEKQKGDGSAENEQDKLMKSNIVIGINKPSWATMNQCEFYEKGEAKRKLKQRLIQKHTHFKLGTGKNKYSTQQNDSFKPSKKARPQSAFNPQLQTSNWSVGKLPLSYDTNYKHSHPRMKKEALPKVRDRAYQTSTHWKLGQHGNPYLSEFKKHFEKKKGINNSLANNYVADLKSSHYGFTDLKKGVFTSDYEGRFRNKAGPPGEMDKQRKQYLQGSHLHMGQSKLNYKSEQVKQFQDLGGEPAALDPSQEKELRDHHFKLKDKESPDKVGEKSDYRNNYTWRINPVKIKH